jgi:large subunit ribosomal protein L6
MKTNYHKEIVLDDKVTAHLTGTVLKIKGPKGEVERDLNDPKVSVAVNGNKIAIATKKHTKKEKTLFGAFVSHIKNMVVGVKEMHHYKLKICSGHFPMNVAVVGNEFVIKNFFGETVPRKIQIPKGVEVKVNGNDVSVASADLELAGMTASRMENMCRITNRDIRRFQDGCYITEKPGRN